MIFFLDMSKWSFSSIAAAVLQDIILKTLAYNTYES